MTNALCKFYEYLEQKEKEEAPTQVVEEPFDLSQEEDPGKIVGYYFPVFERTTFCFVFTNSTLNNIIQDWVSFSKENLITDL